MTGRRKEKGKDVKDVWFPKERSLVEESTNDGEPGDAQAEVGVDSVVRAELGDFVSGGHSEKNRIRKNYGGGRRRVASPAGLAGDLGEQPEKSGTSVDGTSSGTVSLPTPDEVTDDGIALAASATIQGDCEAPSGEFEETGDEGRSSETEVQGRDQRGEESLLQRLERISSAFNVPPLSPSELEQNIQEQEDEILALEAIYGEVYMRFNNENMKTPSFTISVDVEIAGIIKLVVEDPSMSETQVSNGTHDWEGNATASTSGNARMENRNVFSVHYLPPIRLVYTLPISYPSHSPPLFTLSCMWLHSANLSKLCSCLDTVWNDQRGQVVLYSWIEWLKTQCLPFIGMSEVLELGPYGVEGLICRDDDSDLRAVSACSFFDSDIARLLRYNEERKNEEFCKSLHTCNICFTEQIGRAFVKLPCQHMFCHGCMEQYATVHVKEGSVNKLNCPDTTCRGSIPPYILKELLAEETFQRWEDLVLQRSLDAMMDIAYCPRCEAVCIEELDNFAQCEGCFFSFCSLCMQTWHVGKKCVSSEARLSILQERQKGRQLGDAQRKKELEMINEMMNLQYVRREAKQCPKCKMAISKTEGCNKMECSNCGSYFCFRCGFAIEGYAHFRGESCRLFDEEEIVGFQPQVNDIRQQRVLAGLELWPDRSRPCPNCRQPNIKMGNNNHILCWACRTSYCFLCNKIVRRTSDHFGFGPKCRQHSA